jgi:hypothetical protein
MIIQIWLGALAEDSKRKVQKNLRESKRCRLSWCASPRTRVSCGGGSRKSKWMRSLMPRDLRSRTTFPRFTRCISGIGFSSSSCWYAHAVYSLRGTQSSYQDTPLFISSNIPLSRIQCCGSGMFIPDPGSECFPSRIQIFSIPDPGFASNNLSILTQKLVLSYRK